MHTIKYYDQIFVQTTVIGGVFKIVKYSKWLNSLLWLLEKGGIIIRELRDERVLFKSIKAGPDLLQFIYERMTEHYYCTGKKPTKIIVGREQQLELFAQVNQHVMAFDLSKIDDARVFGMQIEMNPLIDGVVLTN